MAMVRTVFTVGVILACASSTASAQGASGQSALGEGASDQGGGRFSNRTEPVSRSQARILSVIFPGLGQLATGHKHRGTALVAAEVGLLVVWLTSHADYNTRREQFDLEEVHYLSLRQGGSFAEADESWGRLVDRKDDLDRSSTLRRVFGTLSVALYAYNLADILFLNGVEPVSERRVTLTPRLGPDSAGAALVARF